MLASSPSSPQDIETDPFIQKVKKILTKKTLPQVPSSGGDAQQRLVFAGKQLEDARTEVAILESELTDLVREQVNMDKILAREKALFKVKKAQWIFM